MEPLQPKTLLEIEKESVPLCLKKLLCFVDLSTVTRVRSQGFINVTVSIVTKDLQTLGYSTGRPEQALPVKVELPAPDQDGAAT